MERFTIGEVAKQAHVGIETLRYYERTGLVARPPRSASNYRLYPQANVHPWKRSNPLILKEKLENCSDYMGFLPLFQELTIPHSSSKSKRNWRFIDTFSRMKQKK